MAVLLSVMASAQSLAQAALPTVGDLQYKVIPGDTLEGVARRLMEQPRRYPEIARLNGLGNQDVIQPRMTLRIPAPYLKMQPEDAMVAAVKGDVTLAGKPVEPGARAAAGADVVTGADGQITLRLADGSEVRLQPGTAARLTEIKRNPVSGARAYIINLVRGRLDTDVAPGNGDNSRFTIHTPTAALGVRGTSFRAASESGSASTEVLETSPRRVMYWRVRSIGAAGEPGPAGPVQVFEFGVSAG